MGIKKFLSFVREQESKAGARLLESPGDRIHGSAVAIDGNHYLYKLLSTELSCTTKVDSAFQLLISRQFPMPVVCEIGSVLARCETNSEQHLVRSLFILSAYLKESLSVSKCVFVLDGAAPDVKQTELVARQRQKRAAHGQILNRKRALLLHRIYVLRWYQTFCLGLAFIKAFRNTDVAMSVDGVESRGILYRKALIRLLQNRFEWALGSEIPEWLFERAARHTFFDHIDSYTTCYLTQCFARMRMTVKTSFLVELDWVNVCKVDASDMDLAQYKDLLLCIVDEMIATDVPATVGKEHQRPFLVCVHVTKQLWTTACASLAPRFAQIDDCWKNSTACFLVCCIVQNGTDAAEMVLPASFADDSVANAMFCHWERSCEPFWCNPDIFAHRHEHVWRPIEYKKWLCSESSEQWLRDNDTSNGETHELITENERLMHLLCKNVPTAYGAVYDTRNDETHKNLLWNDDVCALFVPAAAKPLLPQGWSDLKRDSVVDLRAFCNQFFACNADARRRQKRHVDGDDDTQRPRRAKRVCCARQNANRNQAASLFALNAHDFGAPSAQLTASVARKDQERLRYRLTDVFLQTVVHFVRSICEWKVIVAEHEAEATCAKLCRDGDVDFVLSDDIDTLAFGSSNIVVGWPKVALMADRLCNVSDQSALPCGQLICLATLFRHFSIGVEQFIMWCVLCGSDFVEMTAHQRSSDRKSRAFLSVAKALETAKRCSSVAECCSLIKTVRLSPLQVTRAFQFFCANAREAKTEFLLRQLQHTPDAIDETVNLQRICLTRKLAFYNGED